MIFFSIYISVLMYVLLFSEGYRRGSGENGIYLYNFNLFTEIKRFWNYRKQLGMRAFVLNVLGNVVGFFPYGFIFPILSSKIRNFCLIVLSGFAVSLIVESIQFWTKVGSFDVDDLFLNTLGVMLGYISFGICNWIRRMRYGKKV